jgi:catechol 2,3-dioxygenase-like lactoylglutathione lyase family enzyme
MVALWVPLQVADVAVSLAFYRDRLGLVPIGRWDRPGDAGAVFALGDGRLEVAADGSPPLATGFAIELPDRLAVDRLAGSVPPKVFPRGHYGAEVIDPDGHRVLLFTEE